MRRLGVVAAGAVALCALPVLLPGGSARAAEKEPVSATLTMSRGHELLTVVIKNNGPAYACIDPNYGAQARIFALGRDNRVIRNNNAVEGQAKVACVTLAPRKSIHVVYDLRPLYPDGPAGQQPQLLRRMVEDGRGAEPGAAGPVQPLPDPARARPGTPLARSSGKTPASAGSGLSAQAAACWLSREARTTSSWRRRFQRRTSYMTSRIFSMPTSTPRTASARTVRSIMKF